MNTLNCFWNANPAKCVPITYKVSQVMQSHWQNAFVGKRRQGLIIMPENSNAFVIDNECGEGYLKITEGLGCLPYGHKSVINPIDVSFEVEQVKEYDSEALLEDDTRIDEFFRENYPEVYEKTAALMELINRNKQ